VELVQLNESDVLFEAKVIGCVSYPETSYEFQVFVRNLELSYEGDVALDLNIFQTDDMDDWIMWDLFSVCHTVEYECPEMEVTSITIKKSLGRSSCAYVKLKKDPRRS